MNCGNCVRHVTEALQEVSGVVSATVSLETNRATVRWTPGQAENASLLIQAVKGAGYHATPVEGHHRAGAGTTAHKENLWSNNVALGIAPTALMMFGEWVLRLSDHTWYRWASFALATVAQFGPGRLFYRGAWNQLKAGSSNMDTLVALGSTTAFAYSVWALLSGTGSHLYFMEAAAIISLISAGHWMEARVSARASSSLKALMHLAPETASRQASDGSEKQVSVTELQPGDLVVLKPGDRVPTDGEAIEGYSVTDESMLTGESMPVEKPPGSTLYAGTVNQTGRLIMRVTSVGEDTALAHIVAAVDRAQNSRANIQRLGDRVSSVFVPVVVLVAAGAGLWWGLLPEQAHQVSQLLSQYLWTTHPPPSPVAAAVITAAAVLIIACPCAMGLATPAAIMAAANTAARRGILIRDGVALEKAGTVTAIAFDKTGTLTEGRPKVVASQFFRTQIPGNDETRMAALAASLASMSNHPLSKAVSEISSERHRLEKVRELPGCGVSAREESSPTQAHFLQLGSLRWLKEETVDAEVADAFAAAWMAKGATVVGFSVDGRLVAAYALQDPLKPGAREVIRRLGNSSTATDLGIYVISGDSERTVAAMANELGIHQCARGGVFAEVRPEQKADIVRKLQQQGERVAFVGDGINDAPALEQADLGIAVSRANDIAREAADIVLLRAEVDAIPESLGLARATLRTIKQNLFWAFFYNALGVPLAALGFMSPVLCAAAMGVSDLVVIGNALRLRNWKLRD
jgi:Cu+-exporting ATPase